MLDMHCLTLPTSAVAPVVPIFLGGPWRSAGRGIMHDACSLEALSKWHLLLTFVLLFFHVVSKLPKMSFVLYLHDSSPDI